MINHEDCLVRGCNVLWGLCGSGGQKKKKKQALEIKAQTLQLAHTTSFRREIMKLN